MKKRFFILQCYDVEATISIYDAKEEVKYSEVKFSRTHRGDVKNFIGFMKSIIAYELGVEDYRNIFVENGKLTRKTITVDTQLETISDIKKEVLYKC